MTVDWDTFTAENGPKFELVLRGYRSHGSTFKFVIAAISLFQKVGWAPTPGLLKSLAMYLPHEEQIQVAVNDEGQATFDSPPPVMTSEQLHILFQSPATEAADTMFPSFTNPSWASGIMELLQFELKSCGEQNPDCRRSCMHYLRLLSRRHGVLPPSFLLDDIVKGDHPQWGGGFADVWKGYQSGRPVCLKVLRFFTTTNMWMKLIKQFCREALVWKQLDHPNVLPFLGVSTELFAPSFCLVSPWMSNSNLMVYLEKNPGHDKMKALLEVAEGLVYLHNYSPSIVHADIRGANILVTDQLTCCLADFGLASAVESQSFATTSSNEGGSVRWMAPELLMPSENGESNRQNMPSRDVYAFGCTILEIYTGEPPFRSLIHDITVSTAVVSGQRPARPTTIVSYQLWDLVESCWAQDPLRRPSSRQILKSLQLINERAPEPHFPPYHEHDEEPVSPRPDAEGDECMLRTPSSRWPEHPFTTYTRVRKPTGRLGLGATKRVTRRWKKIRKNNTSITFTVQSGLPALHTGSTYRQIPQVEGSLRDRDAFFRNPNLGATTKLQEQDPYSRSPSSSPSIPISNSSPQCCHCGCRGRHAPSCPFK